MHTPKVICRWASRTQRLALSALRMDAGEATTSCGTIFVSGLEVEGRTGLFGPCMNPNAQREMKRRYAPEVCRRCTVQDKRESEEGKARRRPGGDRRRERWLSTSRVQHASKPNSPIPVRPEKRDCSEDWIGSPPRGIRDLRGELGVGCLWWKGEC